MRKKGTHTYDIFLKYACCPKCQFIFESRSDFSYALGKYYLALICPRCHHCFNLEKAVEQSPIGPIFGSSPKPEFDWS